MWDEILSVLTLLTLLSFEILFLLFDCLFCVILNTKFSKNTNSGSLLPALLKTADKDILKLLLKKPKIGAWKCAFLFS